MSKKIIFSILKIIISIIFFIYSQNTFGQINDSLIYKNEIPSIEDLMNITITSASKKEESVEQIPASIVIITRKDIESYGYKSIFEVLENIPGLFVNKGYYKEGVGVRGFYAEDNVIYLVNGVNQYEVPMVPIETIDKIEIVRGPMSVLYGSGGFFGTINIITNENFNTVRPNVISASYGSLNTSNLFGKYAKKGDDYKISVNVGTFSTDGLDLPYRSLVKDTNYLPLVGIPINKTTKNQLQRNTKYMNISTKVENFYSEITFIEDYRENIYFYPTVSDGSLSKKTYNYITLGYRKDLNEKFSFDTKIDYYKRYRNFNFNFNIDTSIIKKFKDLNFYLEEYIESRAVAESDFFWKPNKNFDFTFGLYSRIELEGVDYADAPFWGEYLTNSELYFVSKNEKSYTNAGFVQTKYQFFNKFYIIGGLRAEKMLGFNVHHNNNQATNNPQEFNDKFKGSKLELIPRFAFIYLPNNSNTIKVLYGEAVRNPAIKEIYSDLWAAFSVGINKENLKPEKIKTFEINYESYFLNYQLYSSLSLFRNNFVDMIQKKQIINQSNGKYYWLYENYGEMNTYGVELSFLINPVKNIKIDVSTTLQETKDTKTKNTSNNFVAVGNSPRHLAYLKLLYYKNNFSTSISCNYVDKMKSSWDIKGQKRVADDVLNYFNIGYNIRFDNFFIDGLYLDFKISNLLDQEIRYVSNSDVFSQRGYIGENRTFRISVGWKF